MAKPLQGRPPGERLPEGRPLEDRPPARRAAVCEAQQGKAPRDARPGQAGKASVEAAEGGAHGGRGACTARLPRRVDGAVEGATAG